MNKFSNFKIHRHIYSIATAN